jgi:predicted nucleotidyltransferase
MKGLMVKTSGVADVLGAALAPLAGQIRVAFIYGSVAKFAQRNGSDVDVMVVGEPTFGEVVSAAGNAQEALARVYSPFEFGSKLKPVITSWRWSLLEMTMSLQDWVRNGWASPHPCTRGQIQKLLSLADRDLFIGEVRELKPSQRVVAG